jgi:hypothetical protein
MGSKNDETNPLRLEAGLCANCVHARRITSARGSVFVLCLLSASDLRFVKYPRLPVRSCSGYSPAKAEPGNTDS